MRIPTPSVTAHKWTPRATAAPRQAKAFASVDEFLAWALELLRARRDAAEFRAFDEKEGRARLEALGVRPPAENAAEWTERFHEAFERTPDAIGPVCRLREASLTRLERELLLAAVLARLSLLDLWVHTAADLLEAVDLPRERMLEGLRALSEEGRLSESGLLVFDDESDVPSHRRITVDADLTRCLLRDPRSPSGWAVHSEEEFLERLGDFSRALAAKAEVRKHQEHHSFLPRHPRDSASVRRVERMFEAVRATMDAHPGWCISKLLAGLGPVKKRDEREELVLLLLAGKALGHLDGFDEVFLGLGIAQAVTPAGLPARASLELLRPRASLMRRGLIQPCDGQAELLGDDPRVIEKIEYELSPKGCEILKLERKRRGRRPVAAGEARWPLVRLEQLVLPPEVQEALRLACAQARHAKVMLKDWGLAAAIPYGRAVTLLFYGPPGVGKTAAAEGLARALHKRILVADYAQIQNCFVGQTEKNIARLFAQARRNQAVLFFDEADAMFVDRDRADRNWEVRDVNVLLQELERFEGVCILATNRKLSLDPALDRRISLKVEFAPPDEEARRAIWRRIVPPRLPLERDTDLDSLARLPLTGGQIKNALLNAARMALARGRRSKVRMQDLEEAARREARAREGVGEPIGFRA
ncbi:MAG: AAA family ATPase [Myxococcales bacterium]|nr:AAA family ATPase [Myxococcales bacterium]